jgi:hypothetical protein
MSGRDKRSGQPETDPLEELLAEAGISMEELMAYADGVLALERRPAVREALRTHPDLMQALEIFLFTKGAFVRPYEELLARPVPSKLVDAVRESRQRSLWDVWRRLLSPEPAYRAPVLVVAGLAAILVTAWWVLAHGLSYELVPRDRQGLAAAPALQQMLEGTRRNKVAEIVPRLTVRPTATFYSNLKAWCRQYELRYDNAVLQVAIACRGSDGVWRLRAQTDPRPADPSDAYYPAGRGAELAAERERIMVGGVLSAAAEELRIQGGWQPPGR